MRVPGPHAGMLQLGRKAATYCRVSTADQSCERKSAENPSRNTVHKLVSVPDPRSGSGTILSVGFETIPV